MFQSTPPLPPLVACAMAVALAAPAGQAQTPSVTGIAAKALPQPRWEAIGPHGGFISAVAYQPGSPTTLLVSGDDSSGLYRSLDDGASWSLIEDTPPESSVYGLFFDPDDANTVYGYSHFGRGVLRSNDGGGSWHDASSGLPWTRLSGLSIDPADGQHLFVCSLTAIYESLDGADSWSPLPNGTPGGTITALSQHSSAPGVLWVGTAETDGSGIVYSVSAGQWVVMYQLPGNVSDIVQSATALYASTAPGAIYRADTNGTNWTQIASGAGEPSPDIPSLVWTNLAVADGGGPSGDRLYVAAWAARGFFRGDESGGSWSWAQGGGDLDWLPGVGNYGFSVAVDPSDPDDVLFGSIGGGLFRTQDGGADFTRIDGPFLCTDSLGLAIDPNDKKHMVISSTEGFDGTPGLYETSDGGLNWSVLPLTTDVTELWISPLDGDVLVAGLFNDGLLRSTDGGQSWTAVLPSLAGAMQCEALVDHPTPGWLLAAFRWSDLGFDPAAGLYLSKDSGAGWSKLSSLPGTSVAIHANDPQTIYHGGVGLTVSHNGGGSWQAAPAFAGLTLLSIAIDPHQPGALYAGGISGDVYFTSDDGQTVQQLSTPAVDSLITSILVDPERPGVVWIASTGVDATITPQTTYGLLGTTDGGTNWRWYNQGLFPGRMLWSLRFVPGNTSQIIAGMWGGSVQRLSLQPRQLR